MHTKSKRTIWIGVGVLLIAAFVILLHADDLSMWFDELWSMFQDTRSLRQVLQERELNWPVGYAVTLYAWIRLIGPQDFVVHMLGASLGMLSIAWMIRAGRTLGSDRAGWLAGLAFGTSGYAVYFFLEARGYGLQLMLLAALIGFQARWIKRPTWRRAIPYTLTQILLLYTHFSSGLVIALTVIPVLVRLPYRQWWRWLAIMAVTGLAFLPILPQFWSSYRLRAGALNSGPLPAYFLKGPESLYRAYSLGQDGLWAGVLILAAVGLGFWLRQGSERRAAAGTVLWLAAWGLGVPLYAYLTREASGLFTTRYLSFTIPAALLLIGLGLAALPHRGWIVGGLLLLVFVAVPWRPFDHRPQYSDEPPVRDLMREMARRFKTGDVLVIDPTIDDSSLAWEYYEPLYISGGRLARTDDGYAAGSRVWYLVRQGSEDPALRESVEAGRIATEFWGPWYFIVTLYEGPSLTPGIQVGDGIRFRGQVPLDRQHFLPGDTLAIETWWSVDERPASDYSIGLHLIGPGGELAAQVDSGPVGSYTPPQTSGWEPGQVYRDDRSIQIPWCIPTGEYQLQLVVYQWWDNERLVPEAGAWRGPDDQIILGTIAVDSFSYCDIAP